MDRRDRNFNWYSEFNEQNMTVTFDNGDEEINLPVVYSVCRTCEGRGSHVNPSIDSHGITADEFDEDPDFREAYFNGRYDQPCNECHGQRVVPILDETRATPEEKKMVEEFWESRYQDEQCSYMERMMGA